MKLKPAFAKKTSGPTTGLAIKGKCPDADEQGMPRMIPDQSKAICRAIVLVLLLAPATSVRAADAVTLHLSYTENHDRILPSPERTATAVNLSVKLETDGTVQHDEMRVSNAARGGGGQKIKLGANQGQAWHVAGADQLINVTNYFTYQRAILVTVSGHSCTAKIGYELKPGQHDYQYPRLTNGERATARSVTATAVSCTIQ
jgi:hypothetical protein